MDRTMDPQSTLQIASTAPHPVEERVHEGDCYGFLHSSSLIRHSISQHSWTHISHCFMHIAFSIASYICNGIPFCVAFSILFPKQLDSHFTSPRQATALHPARWIHFSHYLDVIPLNTGPRIDSLLTLKPQGHPIPAFYSTTPLNPHFKSPQRHCILG